MEQQPPSQPVVDTQTPSQSPPATKETKPEKSSTNDLFSDLTIGLPSAVRLLKESLLLFKQKWLQFIGIMFFPLLLGVFCLQVFDVLFYAFAVFQPILFLTVKALLGFIVLILISYAYLALLFAIKDNEEKISILEAYKRATKHLKECWKVLLFIVVLTGVGLLACIIPGVIFAVWFSVAIFVYIVEDLRGIDALLQSKMYVRGYWTAVLGRFLFIIGIACIIFFPFILFSAYHTAIMYQIIAMLLSLVFLPIFSTYGLLLYGNLRVLKGDTSGYVTALHTIPSTKAKVKLFLPVLIKGGLCGLPFIVCCMYLYLARPFQVQGGSMMPSYVQNQIVFAKVLTFNTEPTQRNDVIILKSPVDPEKQLIKRVIGMPGDKIMIKFGEVYINEVKIDESAYSLSDTKTLAGTYLQEGYTLPIPKGQYVVLGDNREESIDSRDWGPIRSSDIIAKVTSCLWNCPKREER